MFPTKTLLAPRTADEPTCQKTLHDWAPLISCTWEATLVISVAGV